MRDPPTDIGELQAEFEDSVCRLIESSDKYEILDRNISSDPFEPDISVMTEDEWVFRIVCWYQSEDDDGYVDIYPHTFNMRKWVTDHDEDPTFFIMGLGGSPQHPENLYITRFYNIYDSHMDLSDLEMFEVTLFRFDFIYHEINRELCRVFSPQ